MSHPLRAQGTGSSQLLGTELGSSGETVRAFNPSAISAVVVSFSRQGLMYPGPGLRAKNSFEFLVLLLPAVLLYIHRVLICSSGSFRTHVKQAGLELTEIHLPLPP